MINQFSTSETNAIYHHLAQSITMYDKVTQELCRDPAGAPDRIKTMYKDYLSSTTIDTGSGLAGELIDNALRNVRWRELCNHLKEEANCA